MARRNFALSAFFTCKDDFFGVLNSPGVCPRDRVILAMDVFEVGFERACQQLGIDPAQIDLSQIDDEVERGRSKELLGTLREQLRLMTESEFQLFCKGRLPVCEQDKPNQKCKHFRKESPPPSPRSSPKLSAESQRASFPEEMSAGEIREFEKIREWIECGASLSAACLLSDVSEGRLASMVLEVKNGRNGNFKAAVEELLKVPWHFEGSNHRPVMYSSGHGVDWMSHHCSGWPKK